MEQRLLETGTIAYQQFAPSGTPTISAGAVYTSSDAALAGVQFTYVGESGGELQFVPAVNVGTLGAGTLTKVTGTGDASVAYTGSNTSAPVSVQADVYWLGSLYTTTVQFLTDYNMECPIGYPTRPGFTGVSPAKEYPHTLPKGTILALLPCEADALVALGAAVAI